MLALMLYLAPIAGFPIGFLIGRIGQPAVRAAIAVIGIALPLAILVGPDLMTQGRLGYGSAWGLVLFAVPVALWMLFAGLGVWVGWASRKGSN